MEKAMAMTTANTVKARGGSGKTTYLDRIVNVMLDENGEPAEPQTRTEIIAKVSLAICVEQCDDDVKQGVEGATAFDFENEDHLDLFKKVNLKVKPMVAAAVSNSNNSTALSYNDKYNKVWEIVKDGNTVALARIDEAASEE